MAAKFRKRGGSASGLLEPQGSLKAEFLTNTNDIQGKEISLASGFSDIKSEIYEFASDVSSFFPFHSDIHEVSVLDSRRVLIKSEHAKVLLRYKCSVGFGLFNNLVITRIEMPIERKGLGTEFIANLLHISEKYELNHFSIESTNEASGGLAEKLGFTATGVDLDHYHIDTLSLKKQLKELARLTDLTARS
ncbi:GNAT family N-acetyltransferase [Aliagarivorans taiwanensis]|uniref:GNAT family N-acetyltransferase n=1 Tax=Aliagarivorans taiwanensis TaxID=561966 RepID=UPI000553F3C1|nr:GNAT family N-acetyltransferase [Aliagarivorans taiwanensis]